MPRPKKQDFEAIKEATRLVKAAELEPPPSEIIPPPPPSDDRHRPAQAPLDGADRNFATRVRPDGPRQRHQGDEAASFASDDLRIIKDGTTWQMRANRDLTGGEKDFAASQGMTPVDDEERVWNGTQRDMLRADGDINQLAFRLGKNPEGRGR